MILQFFLYLLTDYLIKRKRSFFRDYYIFQTFQIYDENHHIRDCSKKCTHYLKTNFEFFNLKTDLQSVDDDEKF